MCCRAKDEAERRLQEAVQKAEAAERSAAQAQVQLEESGRRHAAATASFEVCLVITHAAHGAGGCLAVLEPGGGIIAVIAAVLTACTAKHDRWIQPP